MANPLLIPPRLIIRALDDLNAIAEAARRMPEIERNIEDRADRMEDHMAAVRESIGSASAGQEEMNAVMKEVRDLAKELNAEMRAVRRVAEQMQADFGDVPDVVAPVQSVAERLDRLTDRLPGTGS